MYLTLLVLGVVVLIQGTLLARLRLFGASPNLLLVIVVCWSVVRGVSDGLVWAFVGGLGLDVVAGSPLGTLSLALMVPCLLGGLGRRRVFANHLLLPGLILALATPLHGWLILLTQQLRGLPVDWAGATVRVILPELALNLALMLVIYPVLRWLARNTGAVVGK